MKTDKGTYLAASAHGGRLGVFITSGGGANHEMETTSLVSGLGRSADVSIVGSVARSRDSAQRSPAPWQLARAELLF